MSKVSEYLNEHLLGEVTASDNVKKSFSEDESILQISPEMVVFPRVANDVRKVARFAWQLAEKNRSISLTARGDGFGVSGGAIGKGIIIDASTYLNKVLYISSKGKNRFVHVQAGVSMNALATTLASVAMEAWSVPGTQQAFLPSKRARLTSTSCIVLFSMCPMCRTPVTLGGGITIQYGVLFLSTVE